MCCACGRSTFPFLEGSAEGWDVARMATALRVFLPAFLRALEPRLGHDFDALDIVKHRMWSPSVREELGVNPNGRFPCGVISGADRAAALRAVPRAVARFAPIRNETLGIFVVMYVELLQSHIKLPLGVNFLEQCLEEAGPAAGEGGG